MQIKEKNIIKTIIIFLLFANALNLKAQNLNDDINILPKAVEFFDSTDYESAIPLFEKLILNNPDDELASYYYGASLIETGVYNDTTNKALLKALSGNTPDKVLYYIGRYFHEKKLWNSALKYYNRFKNYAPTEEQEGLNVGELIDQCYKKLNPTKEDDTTFENDSVITEIATNTPEDSLPIQIEKDSLQIITDQPNELTEVEDKTEIVQATQNDTNSNKSEEINFQINSFIIYLRLSDFKNDSAKQAFSDGKKVDQDIDDLLQQADSLRNLYDKAINKNDIAAKIVDAERITLQLKSERDQLFMIARELENTYWGNASEEEKELFRKGTEKLKNQLKSNKFEDNANENKIESEALTVIAPEVFFGEETEIVKNTSADNDEKVVYKIQIGAYSRGLPAYVDRLYKKLSLIRKIDNYTDDRGVVVYTTGNLTNFEDALQMQKQVRTEGIKDAFVVAYKDGKRITLNEAKKITEEQ